MFSVRDAGQPPITRPYTALVPGIVRIPAVTGAGRPRWSVVIPVHDCADYLAETLPEVVAQLGDRHDAEIIVVDDASRDDPAAVVERLGRGRVRYRPNPGHLGAIGTFNRCLELARGELVHLLHGDDLVLPGFYPTMGQALADPTAVAAVCRVQDVAGDGAPLYTTRSYRRGTGVWAGALDALSVSNRIRTPGVVVRRAAYEHVGGFRTDLPHAADWEMWTRLAYSGDIWFENAVLARHRVHSASDTAGRVASAANIAERAETIRLIAALYPGRHTQRLARQAMGYTVLFAGRTALRLARRRAWGPARAQALAALRYGVAGVVWPGRPRLPLAPPGDSRIEPLTGSADDRGG